jgi:hypothetical protein
VAESNLIELAEYWTYRLGAFVVLNILDDPAWLALIFCRLSEGCSRSLPRRGEVQG